MMNQPPQDGTYAQGGGYGPPPGGGGYGPPPGGGDYGPPGGAPPGGYGPPGGAPPGGYGPPGGAPPGGYGAPPGAPGGYGPPPGGAPMPPPGGGPMPGGPPMMGGGDLEAVKQQTQTWLIIGAVSGLFCGCNLICVVGAVLAYLGGQSAQKGDLADAQSKLKIAKILVIVGVALSLASILIWLALSGLSMLSNL